MVAHDGSWWVIGVDGSSLGFMVAQVGSWCLTWAQFSAELRAHLSAELIYIAGSCC